MSARMRVNRSHTGNRRSHHALKEPRLSTCAKCEAQHLRHRMCPECGNYRDRVVVDVAGKKADKMIRRNKKMKGQEEEKPTVDEKRKDKKSVIKETKNVVKREVKRTERKSATSGGKKI